MGGRGRGAAESMGVGSISFPSSCFQSSRGVEADRMLDLGFIDAVKALISKMPKAGARHGKAASVAQPSPPLHEAGKWGTQLGASRQPERW